MEQDNQVLGSCFDTTSLYVWFTVGWFHRSSKQWKIYQEIQSYNQASI